MIHTQVIEQIKTHFFCSVNCFSKILSFMR